MDSLGAFDLSGTAVVPDPDILSPSSSLESLLLELLGLSFDEVDCKGFFPFSGDLGNVPGVTVCSLANSLADLSVCVASSLASCLLASSMVKVEAFVASAAFFASAALLDFDLVDGFASSLLSSALPDLVLSSSPMLGNCYRRYSLRSISP